MKSVILKYIGIGVLLGIGISIVDFFYYPLIKEEREKNLRDLITTLAEPFYQMSSESIFNNPKKYDPAMGLNFSLQEYELKGDKVLVAGVVSNVGVDQWTGLSVEIEAFNQDRQIIAECSAYLTDLEPGHWEALITECPILKKHIGRPITRMSFRIKKAFHQKRHISSIQE